LPALGGPEISITRPTWQTVHPSLPLEGMVQRREAGVEEVLYGRLFIVDLPMIERRDFSMSSADATLSLLVNSQGSPLL
jgi:hypothetical protein